MLYHYQVFMPVKALAIVPQGIVKVIYSEHAKKASQNDRYGKFECPTYINFAQSTIIEICLREKKIVARFHLDEKRDYVIVVIPKNNHWFAKTVWINQKNDKHKTLDKSRYSTE